MPKSVASHFRRARRTSYQTTGIFMLFCGLFTTPKGWAQQQPEELPKSESAPLVEDTEAAKPKIPKTPNSKSELPKTAPSPAPAPAQVVAPTVTQGTNAPQGEIIDTVLVSVNDELVLLSDLQKVISTATNKQTSLKSNGQLVGGPLKLEDAKSLLEQLIDQKIVTLRVQELVLNVGEDELDAEIDTFLKGQNLNRDKLRELLKSEGESEEVYRTEFRRQLETQRFIGRVIRPLVTVAEDEVRNFYLQQSGAVNNTKSKVKLRSLMLEIPDNLSEAQKQKKLETLKNVQQEIAKGTEFSQVVKLYSEAPDALKTSGELPARPLGDMPAEIQNALKNAKPGQVVGPIPLGSSTFFFEFLGSEVSNSSEFEKQKQTWENKLLEIKFQERLSEYVKAERSKVKIDYRDFKMTK